MRLDLRVAAEAGVVLVPIAVRGELAPKAAPCDSSASPSPWGNAEATKYGAREAKPATMEWLEATELAASPGVAAGAAGLRAPLRMELWSKEAEKSTPSARNSSTDGASMPAAEVGASARGSLKASPSRQPSPFPHPRRPSIAASAGRAGGPRNAAAPRQNGRAQGKRRLGGHALAGEPLQRNRGGHGAPSPRQHGVRRGGGTGCTRPVPRRSRRGAVPFAGRGECRHSHATAVLCSLQGRPRGATGAASRAEAISSLRDALAARRAETRRLTSA